VEGAQFASKHTLHLLWDAKAYIDFEITLQEWQRVRELYERLLERTTHVKVWTSYAKFELTHEGGGLEDARAVYQRGYVVLKREDLKEERVLLLQEWLEAERSTEAGQPDDVVLKMPKKVKMKRMVPERGGMEEYYEWQFPDDVVKLPGLKLLEQAMLWKRKQAEANAAPSQTETREDAANEESGGAADEESDGAADEESDGAADEESDGIAKRRRVDEQCEE
jgi:crooked neck